MLKHTWALIRIIFFLANDSIMHSVIAMHTDRMIALCLNFLQRTGRYAENQLSNVLCLLDW